MQLLLRCCTTRQTPAEPSALPSALPPGQKQMNGVHVVLQLKFDENFDDILDEGSSTHTPEQLPEWACA
jgi:hypothetical protein